MQAIVNYVQSISDQSSEWSYIGDLKGRHFSDNDHLIWLSLEQ